jgi:Ca2+-binding RTX toxin-like protein
MSSTATAGGDYIAGGAGADRLQGEWGGGAGDDIVYGASRGGETYIDCGAGADLFKIGHNRRVRTRGCEQVSRRYKH